MQLQGNAQRQRGKKVSGTLNCVGGTSTSMTHRYIKRRTWDIDKRAQAGAFVHTFHVASPKQVGLHNGQRGELLRSFELPNGSTMNKGREANGLHLRGRGQVKAKSCL